MHSITGRCTGLGADTQAGKNCRFTRSPVTAVRYVNEHKPRHTPLAEMLHDGAMDLLFRSHLCASAPFIIERR